MQKLLTKRTFIYRIKRRKRNVQLGYFQYAINTASKEITQTAVIFGSAESAFPLQNHSKKILVKEKACSDLALPRSLDAGLM